MTTDSDITDFVDAIGASVPPTDSEQYRIWKNLFTRPNYFLLNNNFLIIKISRSRKPFWGVQKDVIEFLNIAENYYLVLLCSSCEGWVFSKEEINAKISSGEWGLANDEAFKINSPLPDKNLFQSHEEFILKLGIQKKQ